jgi:hypothetical protein
MRCTEPTLGHHRREAGGVQFIRVKLIVQDKAGSTVPVAFYTDGRGTEFAQLQPGSTVAILYAHQHGFLDLTAGIRQEEYCGVKVDLSNLHYPKDVGILNISQIISATLAELLQLSDRVHQYSTGLIKKTCHRCDEQKTSLQKCSKCSLFWYCNKVRQQKTGYPCPTF